MRTGTRTEGTTRVFERNDEADVNAFWEPNDQTHKMVRCFEVAGCGPMSKKGYFAKDYQSLTAKSPERSAQLKILCLQSRFRSHCDESVNRSSTNHNDKSKSSGGSGPSRIVLTQLVGRRPEDASLPFARHKKRKGFTEPFINTRDYRHGLISDQRIS